MTAPTATLDGWLRGSHSGDGRTHPTWRRGSGPGVVLIHEMPGMTPEVIGFANEVVESGFTVVMPQLFGTPEAPRTLTETIRTAARVCVSSEFTKLAIGVTTPVAGWLRSLAGELHAELGGPGVGALGMCFTGGFALAMMVDESVAAPVVSQPSTPFPVDARRRADLNLSPADTAKVVDRVRGGCPVLGLRYAGDPATGTRFDTLTELLGDGFLRVEFDGKGHSVLTNDRQDEGVRRVLEFFGERLR